jgi:hypothetical protein
MSGGPSSSHAAAIPGSARISTNVDANNDGDFEDAPANAEILTCSCKCRNFDNATTGSPFELSYPFSMYVHLLFKCCLSINAEFRYSTDKNLVLTL